MNANKLADKWDAQGFSEYELERECGNQMANMLRQQQAEIEALKQSIDANNLNQNIGQFVKPTNKPVAWMDYLEHSDVYDLNVSGRGIPLYTHPHPDNLGLAESIIKQQQAEIEALKAKNLKKSMAIRSLNTQLKKALQYETYSR